MKEKKEKKMTMFHYVVSLIVVAIFASGATVFIYELNDNKQLAYETVGGKQSDDDDLAYLYSLIETGYIEDVDPQALHDGAMKGMVQAIDDPYSSYLTKSEAKEFDDDISGNFEGIGAVMTMTNDMPTVAEPPIKDSPAEKAKMQAGDIILKVDGEETQGKTLNEIVKTVRGEKGTDVVLDIQRDTETFPVTITRDVIPVDSVKGNIDKNDKDVGYIQISSFNTTTSKEFDEVVNQLRKDGAKSFVIDVRGNPGGVLTEVEKISSRFLEDGQPIVKFDSKLEGTEEHDASKQLDNGEKIKEPTVLLVDENSASASEILAGAFIDSAGLDVVGESTFGKGTVQTVIPTGDGGELKLTIKKWLTPDGTWIHEKGVKPTIEEKKPDYIQHKLIDTKITYKLGSTNENVKIINEYLNVLGYSVEDDSDTYSTETQSAIRAFQEKNDLKATGVADKDTIRLLERRIVEHWKDNDTQYQKGMEVLKKK